MPFTIKDLKAPYRNADPLISRWQGGRKVAHDMPFNWGMWRFWSRSLGQTSISIKVDNVHLKWLTASSEDPFSNYKSHDNQFIYVCIDVPHFCMDVQSCSYEILISIPGMSKCDKPDLRWISSPLLQECNRTYLVLLLQFTLFLHNEPEELHWLALAEDFPKHFVKVRRKFQDLNLKALTQAKLPFRYISEKSYRILLLSGRCTIICLPLPPQSKHWLCHHFVVLIYWSVEIFSTTDFLPLTWDVRPWFCPFWTLHE